MPALALGLGAAMMIAGSFLPWVTVNSSFASLSLNGLDGDGIWTVVIGLILVLLAFANFNGVGLTTGSRVLAALGGFGAGAIAIYHILHATEVFNGYVGTAFTGSIGVGLYVIAVGAAVVLVAAGGRTVSGGISWKQDGATWRSPS